MTDNYTPRWHRLPIAGPLPAGLSWCPKCLGVAADVLGLTGRLAAMIAEAAAR